MRIVIINASPKETEGVSSLLIQRLLPFLKNCEYGVLSAEGKRDLKTVRRILRAADGLILVTPVSCGSLPSSFLALLGDMEMHALKREMPVCAVIHGESPEIQSYTHAENMLKIWSEKCHVQLRMTLVVTGSDQMAFWKDIPAGSPVVWKLNAALEQIPQALQGEEKGIVPLSAGSSFLYKKRLEHVWKEELSQNGLTRSDAVKKLDENSFINE